ncbi:MAG: LemA family protein [Elusimicrobia bacterium]|nr:LemA family protein [Elusimicrobiota bacterium]
MVYVLTLISIAILIFIILYNRLITLKYKVKAAWSDIDVQLKRRFDLLPMLADTVKSYSTYERGLFEKITEMRSKIESSQTINEKASLQNDVSKIAKTLLAVAEAYPDLKANQSFIDLQKNISNVEEQIQYARRYYNGTVRDYNTLILSFPSNIVANLFKFKAEDFFEIEFATQKMPPEIKLA